MRGNGRGRVRGRGGTRDRGGARGSGGARGRTEERLRGSREKDAKTRNWEGGLVEPLLVHHTSC